MKTWFLEGPPPKSSSSCQAPLLTSSPRQFPHGSFSGALGGISESGGQGARPEAAFAQRAPCFDLSGVFLWSS